MNNEIVIGQRYTSILSTDTDINTLQRNETYKENTPVLHEPIYRKRTVRTSDFFNKLKNQFSSNNEIMPTGCKFFQKFGSGYKLLIVEETPKIRTIKADIGINAIIEKLNKTGKLKEYGYENYLKESTGSPYSFQLSFPYVVFIILLNDNNELVNVKPFFRLQPVTSLADHLFKAPLYNIPDGQDICLGAVESFPTIYESVENIIELFWLNIYNSDYTNNIRSYNNSDAFEVQDYLTWMYFTKMNPMFIYNVQWIKYDYNLGYIINNTKKSYIRNRSSYSSYELIHDSAFHSNNEDLNPEPAAKNTSFSCYIEDTNIEIGDEITFDNKTYYLYSIVTKNDGYNYDSVELEDSEGSFIRVPYKEFERGFKSIYKQNFLEEADVNGTIIKPGDILNCKIGDYNVYRKVKSLRKALDGKIEAMIGSDHYLIENVDFEIINTSNILIEGKPLDVNKKYYLLHSIENYTPTYRLREAEFTEININNNGGFIIKFKDLDGRNININLNDYENDESSYTFIEEDDLVDVDVLCNFDKILINVNESEKRFRVIKGKGIAINSNNSIRSYIPSDYHEKNILDKILIEDGTRLHIPGTMIDIDFKVGDPIMYANWDNPDDMMVISSVDKFEYDKEDKTLYVYSTSLNKNNNYKIPYVNLDIGRVNIGVIRKVESQCGLWKSGDKIKANSTGITNFPKKDTNTIIAFINDGATKYPLAVCSNLCTLWMNEETINKFDLISLKSTRWPKLDNAPIILEKIKWQHGDNFINKRDGAINNIKFLTKRQGTKYAFEYHYTMNSASLEWGTNTTKSDLDAYYKRHGFIMPRIPVTNRWSATSKRGFPNMLGGFITSNSSRVFIRSEQLKEDF